MARGGGVAAVLLAAALASVHAALPWPQPASQSFLPQVLSLDSNVFDFVVVGDDAPVLDRALLRYATLTFIPKPPVAPLSTAPSAVLAALAVNVTNAAVPLALEVDESVRVAVCGGWVSYHSYCVESTHPALHSASPNPPQYMLTIPPAGGTATLAAATVWGALHGLERFAQLVDWSAGTGYLVEARTVVDAPRFAHRGALIDTARHFLALPTILAYIDALAYNFMNVLHLHIVDDQSFPWVSRTFPNLSAVGAYAAPATTHTYSPADIQTIIAYAADRGVMVMPEYDTPGHTSSWGGGPAGLLTQCYQGSTPLPGVFGPIDPTAAATFPFLTALFTEVAAVYPNQYLHLGGDEVVFDCWASNPAIQAWMASHGYGSNYTLLENYYIQTLIDMVHGLNRSVVIWQDVFDNGVSIPANTIVQAWKGGSTAAGLTELAAITAAGYRGILSAGWYLNYINYGESWIAYYGADPQNFTAPAAQRALVIGGEFAVWGEYVDDNNAITRSWPFGAAIGERLWSPATVTDVNDATVRLQVHECRLKYRGLSVEPSIGPSFCPWEYVPAYNPPFPLPINP